MTKVFIDGSAGTTGLRLRERLQGRQSITLLTAPEELRHNEAVRRELLNACDIAFLCLPDEAAREADSFVENPQVVVLDTSTAHRTQEGWVYGFPELSGAQCKAIEKSKRIAVPGCHASGFIALVAPLVASGLLPDDTLLSCTSLTGYSGGGKKMIAAYEADDRSPLLDAPRLYALGQQHKHLKEMTALTGLAHAPVFCPVVAPYYSGMEVSVPLFAQQLRAGATVDTVRELYREHYKGGLVRYVEGADEDGLLAANRLSGKDTMELSVCGNAERTVLLARYDNLGKGASGAAMECMNLVLGADPAEGLEL